MKYLSRPRSALSPATLTVVLGSASLFAPTSPSSLPFQPLPFGIAAARAADEPVPQEATAKEKELGDKAVEQLSKDTTIKFLDEKVPENKALLDKLNEMAKKLGAVSARPKIPYEVKVIDDPELNAFTLPNGKIYFNKGLLDAAGSDDEIASVMAHEIGHNALMHILRMQKKTKPLNWVGLAAMLAMLSGQNGANIAQITPYILTGLVNSYGVEYEKEADAVAIPMMLKTGYNPSALVTFMNKLADEERRRPQVELGIFQTHPPSPERAQAALEMLKKKGIPFTPRDVEGGSHAMVIENESKSVTVRWNKIDLMELNGSNAKGRADAAAAQINTMMRANLRLPEITVFGDERMAGLVARGEYIVQVSAVEAKAQNTTPLLLAQQWRKNFERLFWSETIKGSL